MITLAPGVLRPVYQCLRHGLVADKVLDLAERKEVALLILYLEQRFPALLGKPAAVQPGLPAAPKAPPKRTGGRT
jgi:hypothetical protein